MKKNSGNILFILVLLFVIAICGVGLKSRLQVDRNLELLYGGSVGCKSCSDRSSTHYECDHTSDTDTCDPNHCIENIEHFAECSEMSCGTTCELTYYPSQDCHDGYIRSGQSGLCADYDQAYYVGKTGTTCSPHEYEKRCNASSCPGNKWSSWHYQGLYQCD